MRGFSLIEVLCAILILVVGIAGLTHGLNTALGSSKESELQTTASLFAAGQIEKLRVEGILKDEETDGDCGDELSLYRWKQNITATDVEGLHEVEVVIESTRDGKTIYALKTLLFELPTDSTEKKDSRKKGGAT